MESSEYGSQVENVYARAGFGAPTRRGSKPAVVVVDLSRGFTEAEFGSGSDLTEVVRQSASLVAAAHAADVPVIYTTIEYTPAEADGQFVTWLQKAPGMRAMRAGSEAVVLDPRLPVADSDVMIVKKGASAFFGTTLASVLTGFGVDTVIVCGATTSGCVRATAVDAVQSGFSVLVPRECCGDRAQGPHDANLFDIQAKYGDVIATSEAVDYLRELAGSLATAE